MMFLRRDCASQSGLTEIPTLACISLNAGLALKCVPHHCFESLASLTFAGQLLLKCEMAGTLSAVVRSSLEEAIAYYGVMCEVKCKR